MRGARPRSISPIATVSRFTSQARSSRTGSCWRSQRRRKLVERVFGWLKTVGHLRKLSHRGAERVDWTVTFAAAVYNLVRLRALLARA